MLELKNVYSGYEKNDILNGLCACFEKGKLTVIIGRNGCGKSTLLKTIMGIVSYQGKISLDGTDISLMKRSECAKRISYLSQGRSIPDMTVGQMVLHGRFPYLKYPGRYSKADYEIARKAMRRMNIEELEHTPISSLSGGIRQNVYIAMALAQDTDYILLDEPTTYLDISHQLALMQTLRELAAEGKGV